MNSHRIPNPQDSQTELDLRELLQALWRRRHSISLMALLGAFIATAHTLLTPPSYQVQSILRPAMAKDLDALNSTGLYTLTPEEALKRVGAALESWDTRRAFLESLGNTTAAEKNQTAQALEGIAVLRPSGRAKDSLSDHVGIKMSYPEGLDGAGLVNGLVTHTIKSEQQRIVLEVKELAKNRQAQLDKKIAAARASHEASKQATPLYFLGTRALKAKRDTLLERKSDDFAEPRIAEIMSQLQLLEHNRKIELLQGRTDEEPFIKNLASWREEAARLQQLETDLNDLRLAIVDQPALKPEKPIAPGKASDILSGAIAGAALGVLLALLRTVFMPAQKREAA